VCGMGNALEHLAASHHLGTAGGDIARSVAAERNIDDNAGEIRAR
jgi:hypothetical protein